MTEVDKEKLVELEAFLYASNSPLSLTSICSYLKLQTEKQASDLISELSDTYKLYGSPLEIKKLEGGRFVLQLKSEYSKQARKFSMQPLLTDGPLRTLSYVAYNQPVVQKQVAEARGSHSYKHLKILEQLGLISKTKKGRQTTITTTSEFADYLGLSSDRTSMRRQLRRIFKKLELKEMEKKAS